MHSPSSITTPSAGADIRPDLIERGAERAGAPKPAENGQGAPATPGAPVMRKPAAEASRQAAADVGVSGRELAPVAPQAVAPREGNRLTTFVIPEPKPGLMRALSSVNRVLCLAGIPGLRRVPLLNRLPGIQGITKIESIDLPASDAARLRKVVNPRTAAFMTPNHPEFFTDWMIDKEISSRFAPMMASWATHTVVNGAGALMQRFWLANNLVAQIPGAGGAAGKAYSIAWALKGHGVLLHPEGHVGWHSDHVATLFSGALDMAIEAARQAEESGTARPVFVAPLVWKLCFKHDETRALGKELDYIEKRLGLQKRSGEDLGQRVYAAYTAMLEKDAGRVGAQIDARAGYFDNQAVVVGTITTKVRALIGAKNLPATTGDAIADMRATARAASRWLRENPSEPVDKKLVRSLLSTGERVLRLTPELYLGERLTQEQIAENCKRLRTDYCKGSLRDTIAKFVPRPVGPRVAHLRVPEPVDVSSIWRQASKDESMRAAVLDTIRERMQAALDTINREHPPVGPTVENPFLRRSAVAAA